MKNIKYPTAKRNAFFAFLFTVHLTSFGQNGMAGNALAAFASNNKLSIEQTSANAAVKLLSFAYSGERKGLYTFECTISNIENVKSIVLEGTDSERYHTITSADNLVGITGTAVITLNARQLFGKGFRLRLLDNNNEISYSDIIHAAWEKPVVESRIWPNPAMDKLNIEIYTEVDNAAHYMIQDIAGIIARQGEMHLKKGTSSVALNIDDLAAGVYQLTISQTKVEQPISLLFVKQ